MPLRLSTHLIRCIMKLNTEIWLKMRQLNTQCYYAFTEFEDKKILNSYKLDIENLIHAYSLLPLDSTILNKIDIYFTLIIKNNWINKFKCRLDILRNYSELHSYNRFNSFPIYESLLFKPSNREFMDSIVKFDSNYWLILLNHALNLDNLDYFKYVETLPNFHIKFTLTSTIRGMFHHEILEYIIMKYRFMFPVCIGALTIACMNYRILAVKVLIKSYEFEESVIINIYNKMRSKEIKALFREKWSYLN